MRQVWLLETPLRSAVVWFSERMEAKLQKHDHDRGRESWLNDSIRSLYGRIEDEKRELYKAICDYEKGEGSAEKIIEEAADLANFAMMVADCARDDMGVDRD